METLNRKGNEYRYYSSSSFDKGYFPSEFKKLKPPIFDGDVKNMEDVEAWILGMNKLFELHE